MADLTDERMMILQMISEEKITAEEGAKLLKALTSSGKDVEQKHHKEKHKFIFINPMDEVEKHSKKKAKKSKKAKKMKIKLSKH